MFQASLLNFRAGHGQNVLVWPESAHLAEGGAKAWV
jgi:hypothetical protein